MELVDAADVHVDLVDHPELQVVCIAQHTHLVCHVELLSAIEVEDAVEVCRVPIKIELIVLQTVPVEDWHHLSDPQEYNFVIIMTIILMILTRLQVQEYPHGFELWRADQVL